MGSASSNCLGPPGGLAVPDDQGNLGFCSRFALGKAIGNGFMESKFAPHTQLDFDQRDISTAIVNSDKVEIQLKVNLYKICLIVTVFFLYLLR